MNKKIKFLKIGGSVITNKEKTSSLKKKRLSDICRQIADFIGDKNDELLLIGHGAGSFGHTQAEQYRTKQGFVSDDSKIGMTITQNAVANLNRLVVSNLIDLKIPAVSMNASNILLAKQKKSFHADLSVLIRYLEEGLYPVTHGDVIVDLDQGCTIFSTEKIFRVFIEKLTKKGYQISEVIHVTDVDGVLDRDRETIQRIKSNSIENSQDLFTKTKGYDVTGGMRHKVEESIKLAKRGIKTKIINGKKQKNVFNALTNSSFIGTEIS